ncbi:Uncharacterized protein XB15_01367 [Leptospira santarosai]|nr:Uncharacterized protein XB15_01367 [Leptospira santarosai]
MDEPEWETVNEEELWKCVGLSYLPFYPILVWENVPEHRSLILRFSKYATIEESILDKP